MHFKLLILSISLFSFFSFATSPEAKKIHNKIVVNAVYHTVCQICDGLAIELDNWQQENNDDFVTFLKNIEKRFPKNIIVSTDVTRAYAENSLPKSNSVPLILSSVGAGIGIWNLINSHIQNYTDLRSTVLGAWATNLFLCAAWGTHFYKKTTNRYRLYNLIAQLNSQHSLLENQINGFLEAIKDYAVMQSKNPTRNIAENIKVLRALVLNHIPDLDREQYEGLILMCELEIDNVFKKISDLKNNE